MEVTDKLITAAEGTAVTLLEFKQHLRWPSDDGSEDVNMNRKLNAAIDDFKDFTGRPLLTESWRMLFDTFPSKITLSKAPVDTESIVVKYYDEDDNLQTLSSDEYKIIDGGQMGMTSIKFDGNIPSVYDKPQAIYIDYDAGWDTIPDKVVAGILEQASDYFEYRASDDRMPVVPKAYRAWYSYKLFHNYL
jgi:uncharacterized phiE125 gp8 family phage protein